MRVSTSSVKNSRIPGAGRSLFRAVLAGAALAVFLAFTAYAEDYTITSADWASGEDGYADAYWNHGTAETDHMVRLYRGSEDAPVTKWIRVKDDHADFTAAISQTGTGWYFFEVWPVNGGEELVKVSDYLVIDGAEMERLKAWLKEISGSRIPDEGVYGWIRYPDGSWKYHEQDGSYASGWKELDGKRYYFSANHIMLTGWQIIQNHWYYFEESGALLRNAVTPDGFSVDSSGMLILNGTPADASFQPGSSTKRAAETVTALESIRITSGETKVAANVVRPMEVKGDSTFTVMSYDFSRPYSEWKPGEAVTVTAELCANAGYAFTDNTSVTFNRGTLISFTGGSVERTVVYSYRPRLVLPSPENVNLSAADGVLRWSPCRNAARYIVSLTVSGEKLSELYTTTNSIDLTEYLNTDDICIGIRAIATENLRNYYYDSFETKAEDIDIIRIDGKLVQSGGKLLYKDGSGSRVSGWAELIGHWYHFTDGWADGPGWWQDSDGNWYYFDENFRMCTGELTENGRTCFLNDGTVAGRPLGALTE